MLPLPPIMLITDATQAVLPLDDIIQQSLQAGCRWILLRDPAADDNTLTKQALEIKKHCAEFDAKLFISRNVNVAKAVEADGLHLSAAQNISDIRDACRGMFISKSCHSIEDAIDAEQQGADLITLSPIFITQSKPGYGPALGLGTLKNTSQQIKIPVIALGGINVDQVSPCFESGAAGIAVMGNIMRSQTPMQTMRALLQCSHT